MASSYVDITLWAVGSRFILKSKKKYSGDDKKRMNFYIDAVKLRKHLSNHR